MAPSPKSPNRILSRLSKTDFGMLEPYLEPVDLPLRKILAAKNKRVDHVYFPESGMASVVANGGQAIEIGIIGREGMTGPSVVMGNTDRVPYETYMQIAGQGQRIKAGHLREAIATNNSLHQVLLAYVFSFMTQTTQTALANGRSKIEERLARWLLMARDRVDSDELPLTHEFLAIMLGVRRSGVTVALQELERKGMIAHRRSVITIIDREGLEHSSNGTYSPPNDW
jgi:CRP-like cAMP-binding protein